MPSKTISSAIKKMITESVDQQSVISQALWDLTNLIYGEVDVDDPTTQLCMEAGGKKRWEELNKALQGYIDSHFQSWCDGPEQKITDVSSLGIDGYDFTLRFVRRIENCYFSSHGDICTAIPFIIKEIGLYQQTPPVNALDMVRELMLKNLKIILYSQVAKNLITCKTGSMRFPDSSSWDEEEEYENELRNASW